MLFSWNRIHPARMVARADQMRFMTRSRRISSCWRYVLTILAMLTCSLAPSAAASAATAPEVQVCGQGPALLQPTSMILTCADHGTIAQHLHWSSWTGTRATATGVVTWRACAGDCPRAAWGPDSATAQFTLADPVPESGGQILFTKLRMHVTGHTPPRFLRNLTFSEAPVLAVPAPPAARKPATAGPRRSPAAASGTLGYTAIEGYWVYAGGPSGSDPNVSGHTYPQVAAAITACESSFEPGIIQAGQPYSTTGWGLWQITPGNSVPGEYGSDYQLLDPWNNAEGAVWKYDQAGGFSPWTTYVDGCYANNLQSASPDLAVTDPGEYVQINSAPAGTPSSPAPDPGSTYGPGMPDASVTSWLAAINDSNDQLFLRNSAGDNNDVGLGIAPATSPSLVESADGSWLAAINDNKDQLWLHNSSGGNLETELGMAPGSSPSLVQSADGSWLVAVEDNDDQLFLRNSAGGTNNVGLGMAPGTSPSLVESSDGSWLAAINDNQGQLWLHNSAGDNLEAELDMAAGTSPSLLETADGGSWLVAFQDSANQLFLRNSAGGTNATGLDMVPGTSPALSAPAG
jgi:Transglycosylase SLT domain